MPEVVRHGDRARRGGNVIVEQALAHSEEQRDARVGDLFACAKHPGPPAHRLLNGCWFNRVEGKPVAIAYVTKASCGCRIVSGSTVYRCCKHLDAKARRLAEREALIEGARAIAEQAWCEPGLRDLITENADRLERLNQDVRYADATVSVYGGATDPRFTSGHGNSSEVNAPEGMIRVNDPRFVDELPEALRDPELWDNPRSGLQGALYYDELTGQYIVTFRGTEGLSDRGDLESNGLQAHGDEAPQYTQAMRLGRLILENGRGFLATAPSGQRTPNMHFAGHSLGGGLASAAGTVAGHRFTTFNAAGVHENTITRFTQGDLSNADAHPLGTRYYTSKDPLTHIQTERGSRQLYTGLSVIPGLRRLAGRSGARTRGRLRPALGSSVHELPSHAWRTETDDRFNRPTRDAGWLGGHSSLTVVQSIESQKQAAIDALKNDSRTAVYKLHKRNNPGVNPDWVFSQPVWESW